MQSLTPSPSDSPPGSFSPPSLFLPPLPRSVCRCTTATILPPLPPSFSYQFFLTSPLPPYTSTHHPSSSLFCCYIIATITATSTPQALSSSPSDSPSRLSHLLPSPLPSPPFCLSLYHSDHPIPTCSPSLSLPSPSTPAPSKAQKKSRTDFTVYPGL